MLWDGTYGFSSLSDKTRKSDRLQMSLQRQHFLLSYFKTLSVGPAGVWTRDLAPAQQTDTLPTELTWRLFTRRITWGFIHVCTLLIYFSDSSGSRSLSKWGKQKVEDWELWRVLLPQYSCLLPSQLCLVTTQTVRICSICIKNLLSILTVTVYICDGYHK